MKFLMCTLITAIALWAATRFLSFLLSVSLPDGKRDVVRAE